VKVRAKVKLQRATGGCLGAKSRGRAWRTTIRLGEPRAGCDPRIPEWGNPTPVMRCDRAVGLRSSRRGEPGELKHLSTPRKRKQKWFP